MFVDLTLAKKNHLISEIKVNGTNKHSSKNKYQFCKNSTTDIIGEKFHQMNPIILSMSFLQPVRTGYCFPLFHGFS